MTTTTIIPATAAPARRRELLKGGAKITEHIIKRKAEREDIRWFYGQLDALGSVIWRLKEDGELLSWTDELDELLETRMAQAKADALAAAKVKIAEKEALLKDAAKAARPAPTKARKASPAAKTKAPHRTRSAVAAE